MTRASALRGGGGASTRAAGARRSGAGGALVAPDQLVDGGEQGPPLGVDGVVDLLVVGRRVEDDVAGVGQRHDLGAPLRVLLPGAPLRLAEPLELDDDRRHRGRPAGAPRRASRDRRAPQTPRLMGLQRIYYTAWNFNVFFLEECGRQRTRCRSKGSVDGANHRVSSHQRHGSLGLRRRGEAVVCRLGFPGRR